MYGYPYLKEFRNHMPTPNGTAAAPETIAITVLLTDEQTALMDKIAVAIRTNTGRAISRSAMIRAIVEATLPQHREWLRCSSETELRNVITQRLDWGKIVSQRVQTAR